MVILPEVLLLPCFVLKFHCSPLKISNSLLFSVLSYYTNTNTSVNQSWVCGMVESLPSMCQDLLPNHSKDLNCLYDIVNVLSNIMCVTECVYVTTSKDCTYWGQKRSLYPLESKLQGIVSSQPGSGNQIWSSRTAESALNHWDSTWNFYILFFAPRAQYSNPCPLHVSLTLLPYYLVHLTSLFLFNCSICFPFYHCCSIY